MAVKVVSDKPVKPKHHVCGKCKYKLEYTDEDVRVVKGTDIGGGSETSYYLDCPRPKCKEINLLRVD